ncbi:hypothetical protein F5148DRAFT_426179 [Russula earlei]|uniref:Uncharacterized protein n=1 Tax=Russula earlei TaxID=71964 RepID=A0ACC0TZA6_9AGAM|nr:hypothetical protein F5148DRAFT_426179 [Russula earlei]
MDKFVSGLPALIHSPLITDATITVGALVTDGMLERVEEHLKSSMASRELSQSASIARAFACLESLDAIFSVLEWTDHPRCTRTISALVKSSDVFRTRQDSALALRAACIRALTFRKLIGPLSARATTHPLRMPPHLLPLALRLQTWTSINSRLWRNQSYLDEAEMRLAPDGYDAPATVIYDGHLISFLVLIRDVLSYAERPTLELPSVWETLETMVGDFTINQPAASAAARSRLEEIRTEIREYLFVPQKGGSREGPNKVSLMPVSFNMDNSNMATVGGLTTSGDGTALRVPNRSPTSKVDAMVQKSLPVHIAERYSQLLEFTDKVAKGLRLVTVLSAKLPQPSATEPFTHTSELRLRHQIYAQDPFSSIDVLDVFLTNLPLFVQATSEANARYTVEDIITSDGLFRSISGHLETSINSEVPETTRERTSMTCLQVLEQVFTLLKGSPTVRWYEVGVDALLSSANNVAFSSGMVGEASAIHAYCTLGIIIHVVIGQLRSRTAQNLDEQLFVLKIYDWLCLGDEQERARREDRAQGDANTNREASSPQYLSELLTNGPFQNFSIMAFHMVPHLEDKEAIPDVAWTTLRELRDALNLADVDDPVALHYFGVVRKSAHQAVVDAEGSPSKEQLDVLELLNNVAEELGLPNLPMPNPVTPPQTPPGVFVPPNRSEYAPIYI